MKWSTLVAISSPMTNQQGVPTPMQCDAPNAVAARAYFEKFGRVIAEVKIIDDKR